MGIFDELSEFHSSSINFNKRLNSNSQNGEKGMVSKKKPSEKLLDDISDLGFNMTQLKEVLVTNGNMLIVSCAGSGKTTSIIFKVIYDLKSGRSTVLKNINGNPIRVPDNIWVATFLRSGSEELKSSYRKWCYKLHCTDLSQVMSFSTLHAEFKRALSLLGVSTDIISDADNKKLLKKVLKNYGVKSSRGGALSDEEFNTLLGAFTRTRNRLDSSKYLADIYDELGLVDIVISKILRDWKNERILANFVDFEDLQELLYEYCYIRKDESIINFLSERYNFIYIDEFQDVSQIQYALLKVYGCNAKQIVAIGDDDQTIYSWRGSDNKIITTDFVRDFNPKRVNLSVNFRCPSNILNAIKPSIKLNNQRFDKDLASIRDGGKVRIGEYQGYRYMVSALTDLVYEDVKNGRSVAVLCRVNTDGLLPAIFFDKIDRFSFSISSAGMTLDSYVGRLVISIIKLFTDKYSQDVSRALSLLSWDRYGVQSLISVCKSNNESIWSISKEDLRYSCMELSEKILDWRDFRENSDEVATLRYVLAYYRHNVFTKSSQFNDVVNSTLLSIESLLEYYDYDNVADFLYEIQDINTRLKGREKKSNAQVKIATVHEFKGKEADSVYIWNDSFNVFPYKRSCSNKEEYEEERRVHYIACTRARQCSTMMYLKGKKGDFLNEMDLSGAEIQNKETSGVLKKKVKEEGSVLKGLKLFSESVMLDE